MFASLRAIKSQSISYASVKLCSGRNGAQIDGVSVLARAPRSGHDRQRLLKRGAADPDSHARIASAQCAVRNKKKCSGYLPQALSLEEHVVPEERQNAVSDTHPPIPITLRACKAYAIQAEMAFRNMHHRSLGTASSLTQMHSHASCMPSYACALPARKSLRLMACKQRQPRRESMKLEHQSNTHVVGLAITA